MASINLSDAIGRVRGLSRKIEMLTEERRRLHRRICKAFVDAGYGDITTFRYAGVLYEIDGFVFRECPDMTDVDMQVSSPDDD